MLGELSTSPLEAFFHSVPTASHLSNATSSSRRERTQIQPQPQPQPQLGFHQESESREAAGTSKDSRSAPATTVSNRGSSRAPPYAKAHTSDNVEAFSMVMPGNDGTAVMASRAEADVAGARSGSRIAKPEVGRLQTHGVTAGKALSSSMSQQHHPEAAEEVERSLVSSRSSVKDAIALLESQQQSETAVQRYMACTNACSYMSTPVQDSALIKSSLDASAAIASPGAVSFCLRTPHNDLPFCRTQLRLHSHLTQCSRLNSTDV